MFGFILSILLYISSCRLSPSTELPESHGLDAGWPEEEKAPPYHLHGGTAWRTGKHVQQNPLPWRFAPRRTCHESRPQRGKSRGKYIYQCYFNFEMWQQSGQIILLTNIDTTNIRNSKFSFARWHSSDWMKIIWNTKTIFYISVVRNSTF